MKLRLFACVIASFILLAVLFLSPVRAQSEIQNRSAEINFIPGTGPVEPLDPDFPDSSLSNHNGIQITGDSDSLSLNVVPNFTFAQSDGAAYPAQLVGERVCTLYSPRRPFVQVSDLRGSGSGWKLSVSGGQFQRDGTPVLYGAKIRLFGATAISSNKSLTPPDINSQIVIECDDEITAPITIADTLGNPDSMGAWIIRWYPLDSQGNYTASAPVHTASVDLYIPSGSLMLPGSYTTTLTWILTDAA